MLSFVLLAISSTSVISIDCYTQQSSLVTTSNAKASTTCPTPYTLVSCGAQTLSLSGIAAGSYIASSTCFAHNHEDGAGVYAFARCCDLSAYSVTCTTYKSPDSGAYDDARTEQSCSSDTILMGCSAYGDGSKLDGSYGDSGPEKQYAYIGPSPNVCTGWASTYKINAYATCCQAADFDKVTFDCVSAWGDPSTAGTGSTTSVSCPMDYFMTGCSGSGAWVNANQYIIDNDVCIVRNKDATWVLANAVCCRVVTVSPTVVPTDAPTNVPTKVPTMHPTINPTSAPSNAPSIAPSIGPTSSPTTCYEQDGIFSNDGAEDSIMSKLLDLTFIKAVNDTSKISDVFEKGLYFSKILVLSDDDTQELRCRGDNSCLYSSISMENNFISNILCNGAYSCAAATINIKNCQNTQIICDGTHSCSDMSIYIHSALHSDIKIDCGVSESCTDLQIDIIGQSKKVEINCIDVNSCDGLYASTDAANYKNSKLNIFSYSKNVTFANGFGFEELNSSTQYVGCNTANKWVKWNTSWSLPDDYLILSEYINNQFPCNDVIVECWQNNVTHFMSTCFLQYHINLHPFNIAEQSTRFEADCYWVELKDVFSISCDGDCVSSPTYDPTMSPTASPTEPTSQPTQHPTADPTIDPTRDPTQEPTHDPTDDPTVDPTFVPTIGPTADPSMDPTTDPSTAPSNVPTTPPTSAPTVPPSNAPSYNPTAAPSTPPSRAPTSNPTYSPSTAPTRLPTINIKKAYDTFIVIQYAIWHLSVTNKQFIVSNTLEAVGKMEEMIEVNYFADEVLYYTDFFANILTINDKNVDYNDVNVNADGDLALTEYDLDINNIEQRATSLSCRIECNSDSADFIITTTFTDSFIKGTQYALVQFFENENVSFVVESSANTLRAFPKTDAEEEEEPTALILSMIIVSIGLFFSVMTFIYNRLSFTKVDNAVFFMPLLVSLNIYDFLSDVNLAAIIIEAALLPEYRSYTSLMFWLAVMSVFFILLPFSSNLLYAMRIRKQRAIKENPAARAYFGTHLAQFILLCVFCAGTYPVLGLTSSRLFGLEILDAGLLSSELHQLSKIKIRSTICLENAPQLLIQVLFTVLTAKDGIKTATILAFVASSLSVVASVIIYQAQKDVSEEFIVEKYFIRLYNGSGITNQDSETIKFCKGLKGKLGEALCQVFNIPKKSIEIGFVTVNDHGLIVHLQHQIYKEELDTLKRKLLSDSNIAMPSTGYVIDITSDMYIERLFDIHRIKICNAFVDHFRMNDRRKEFVVSYHKHIEDANEYDDKKVSKDVEGGANEMFVALKQKINVMSRKSVFDDHRMTSASYVPITIEPDHHDEKKEESDEMLEMIPITTPQGDEKNNGAFEKFQLNMKRYELNLEAKMKQQLQLNLDKQMKQQSELQKQMQSQMQLGLQQMQSQMKMFERTMMQCVDAKDTQIVSQK